MTLLAEDYAGRTRGSVWERDLARELRRHSEGERLSFIRSLAEKDLIIAMLFARRCLNEHRSFFALMDQALETADASSIKYWLETIVPRLGMVRTVAALKSRSTMYPVAVKKALYWMPMFSTRSDYSREAVRSIIA